MRKHSISASLEANKASFKPTEILLFIGHLYRPDKGWSFGLQQAPQVSDQVFGDLSILRSVSFGTLSILRVSEHVNADKNEQQNRRKMNIRRLPLMPPQPIPNGATQHLSRASGARLRR